MNKVVAICVLVVSVAVIACISAYAPRWLNDQNKFLADFVNYNLLSILGVILAITLASASQLHLKLNEIEERAGKQFLHNSRKEIKSSAIWLIGIFGTSILVVVVKPILVNHNFGVAFVNGTALWLLLLELLILSDLTVGVFSIGPMLPDVPPTPAVPPILTAHQP